VTRLSANHFRDQAHLCMRTAPLGFSVSLHGFACAIPFCGGPAGLDKAYIVAHAGMRALFLSVML
jgi:hypothetical protein